MSYQTIQNLDYKQVVDNLLEHSVPEINVKQALLLQNKQPVYFLDARTPREYQVSHLKNSKWIGYKRFKKQHVSNIPKDKTVIVYCSVGYRSEKITEQLQKLGFEHVFNLYGGIFEWINQEQPIFQGGKKTDSIHVYNYYWGRWVKKGKKTDQ